jgi:hypothetical protein
VLPRDHHGHEPDGADALTAVTDTAGVYRLLSLPPADTPSRPNSGACQARATGVLAAGLNIALDISLKVGSLQGNGAGHRRLSAARGAEGDDLGERMVNCSACCR